MQEVELHRACVACVKQSAVCIVVFQSKLLNTVLVFIRIVFFPNPFLNFCDFSRYKLVVINKVINIQNSDEIVQILDIHNSQRDGDGSGCQCPVSEPGSRPIILSPITSGAGAVCSLSQQEVTEMRIHLGRRKHYLF